MKGLTVFLPTNDVYLATGVRWLKEAFTDDFIILAIFDAENDRIAEFGEWEGVAYGDLRDAVIEVKGRG